MIKVYMHTCPMQMKDHKEGGTGLVKWAKGLTEIFPLDLIFFTDKHSAPQQCWFQAVSLSCSGYDSACLARLDQYSCRLIVCCKVHVEFRRCAPGQWLHLTLYVKAMSILYCPFLRLSMDPAKHLWSLSPWLEHACRNDAELPRIPSALA